MGIEYSLTGRISADSTGWVVRVIDSYKVLSSTPGADLI